MKIKNIKYAGTEPVYDLYVDRYHNFVTQGGVVLHNCDSLRYFCVSRPLAAREIDERGTEERMLANYKESLFAKNKKVKVYR